MKHQWKIDQTSTKHQSKMDQTSIKNRQTSRSGGLQGRFGGLLGQLGRSKASLEQSWTVLEASWRQSWKGSWRPLWPPRAEKDGQHSSKLAFTTEPKSVKSRSQNRLIFWCLLESVIGWILMYFGCQNGAKLAQKWDQTSMLTSKGEFSKNLIFPREKQCFLRSRGSKNQEKIKKIRSKNEAKMGIALGIDFPWIFVDFWRQIEAK